ncbi:heavy metal translocating P-type ATPase [Roseateles amylovorans]|uniref:Cation-translocating P-type ATPase n=1 Tax=Roseateles amylovorans TaxID=2978473 RepID=A0ABY6B9Y7_9BURK|nr:cation-translocating P-type ATPase [Roseateles amylovorans]UXH80047.1 cation-translocating P-type ATPase [Roseateles amylovorans]
MARSRLRLSGMHCAGCAGLIESLLDVQPGVVRAQVGAATQRLTLDWWPHQTRLSDLRQVLQSAGYDLAPDVPDSAQDLRRREHRQALWRLFVAGFLMMQVMMLAWPTYIAEPGEMTADVSALLRWGQWVMTLPVMLLAAGPFFRAAWVQVRSGRVGMDVPVALGLAVAFVAGTGATLDPGGAFGHEVYFDSITMFVCFLLGARYLELRSRHRAALALEQAVDVLPDQVERCLPNGDGEWVSIDDLTVGDRIRVAAGQRIPTDAVIEVGSSDTDESLLTGESHPVHKVIGDSVLAGSLNLTGAMRLRITSLGADTRLAGIQRLMREAFLERPGMLRLSDRVAGGFLWVVLLLAAGAAGVWQFIDPSRALAVSVSVLIVTCPCALSLAAPAAWVAAAGRLARRGFLLSRLDAIESLARVNQVVMDKTGTLTDAAPALGAQWPTTMDPAAREVALAMARASHHPLSKALVRSQSSALPSPPSGVPDRALAAGVDPSILTHSPHRLDAPNGPLVDVGSGDVLAARANPGDRSIDLLDIQEHPGLGLEARDRAGQRWRLGSAAWASSAGQAPSMLPDAQLVLGCDGRVVAAWRFQEQLRDAAVASVQAWRDLGLSVTLLSGDRADRVESMARQAGITQWQGGASPEDKLACVTHLQQHGGQVLMLGDGINDAPVLARAQVSVAMGQGADLAKSRADALLVGNRLDAVTQALRLAHRTRAVVRQNLAWSALYNAICVPLALMGWLPPWAAGLGMALSSLFVVANAARLGRG